MLLWLHIATSASVLDGYCIFYKKYCPQVEKTPAVIKKGLKKEEAEALKTKIESGTARTLAVAFVLVH